MNSAVLVYVHQAGEAVIETHTDGTIVVNGCWTLKYRRKRNEFERDAGCRFTVWVLPAIVIVIALRVGLDCISGPGMVALLVSIYAYLCLFKSTVCYE